MKKCILISSSFLILAFQTSASTYTPCTEAETNAQTCWNCGQTCSARLTYENEQDAAAQQNATLTFSGSGKINNYESPHGNPDLIGVEPWYQYRDTITKAVVEEGITAVGARSIYRLKNLAEVSLPDSLSLIEQRAFYGSHALQNITLPENLTAIGNYAFQGTNITKLVLPQNVKLSNYTFWCENKEESCIALPLENLYCAENNMTACQQAVAHLGITPMPYQNTNGKYLYNSRFYDSLSDIASGNYNKKRIYTVDEANTVAGKKNSFKIRYK